MRCPLPRVLLGALGAALYGCASGGDDCSPINPVPLERLHLPAVELVWPIVRATSTYDWCIVDAGGEPLPEGTPLQALLVVQRVPSPTPRGLSGDVPPDPQIITVGKEGRVSYELLQHYERCHDVRLFLALTRSVIGAGRPNYRAGRERAWVGLCSELRGAGSGTLVLEAEAVLARGIVNDEKGLPVRGQRVAFRCEWGAADLGPPREALGALVEYDHWTGEFEVWGWQPTQHWFLHVDVDGRHVQPERLPVLAPAPRFTVTATSG